MSRPRAPKYKKRTGPNSPPPARDRARGQVVTPKPSPTERAEDIKTARAALEGLIADRMSQVNLVNRGHVKLKEVDDKINEWLRIHEDLEKRIADAPSKIVELEDAIKRQEAKIQRMLVDPEVQKLINLMVETARLTKTELKTEPRGGEHGS